MAPFGGLHQERRGRGVVPLDAQPVEIHEGQIDLADGKAPIGHRAEPAHRFAIVERDAAAFARPETERELRQHLAARRRFPIPPRGLGRIALDAHAVLVQLPEIELRPGVALLGRQAIPARRLGQIPTDVFAVREFLTQAILRRRIAGLGFGEQRSKPRVLRRLIGGGLGQAHNFAMPKRKHAGRSCTAGQVPHAPTQRTRASRRETPSTRRSWFARGGGRIRIEHELRTAIDGP